MRIKIIICLFAILFNFQSVYSAVMEGGISKTGMGDSSRIIDNATNLPVAGAKVSLPKQNYSTVSDSNGAFKLKEDIKGTTIMSVEKEGYRPFSLTIDERIAAKPIVVGIEKSNVQDEARKDCKRDCRILLRVSSRILYL